MFTDLRIAPLNTFLSLENESRNSLRCPCSVST
ncbi:hypothetical protein [Enterococcus phage vB_Efs8_KEN04]|uniref:Uncharacterized protein n=1 Tax=Enterococcus phage vB_Efs6_KEN16 TaxID=3138325 RepID=A0AAX4PS21_9CAUD